jgi:tetratricopeptide (TPR) repeat protein
MAQGWAELQKAQSPPAPTPREREYIAALSAFYKPGPAKFQDRVDAYTAAMDALRTQYPDDIDATAFYALALLADTAPDDLSLAKERNALALIIPLFDKYPDHPGLAHYIIHSADYPSLAPQALHAAQRYAIIAPSGAHAAHMGGHIFARLGMWPDDIRVNLIAVTAAQEAAKSNRGGGFDQLHPDEFLLYAYLQSGQDDAAKALLDETASILHHMASMPAMAEDGMEDMVPGYQTEFPIFYALERGEWQTAASIPPAPGAPAEVQFMTCWGRAIALGHLKDAPAARANLDHYEALMQEVKKGPHAYYLDGAGPQLTTETTLAWTEYALGHSETALQLMRQAADLQDKVGQGEVDIPIREMLADMLLDLGRPADALVEYDRDLQLSPNRFNGVYNAARAAEAAKDLPRARKYYATLLQITDNGAHSTRHELAHAKAFLKSNPTS